MIPAPDAVLQHQPLPDLNWLLTGFCRRTPGVVEAVVVSVDGLLMAKSDGLDRATADQVAAVASALASLTRGAGRMFDAGKLRQILVDYEGGYVVLSAISEGSVLAAVVEAGSDVGLIGYEMTLLARKTGTQLTPDQLEALRAQLPA